jgi:hypothetical protein
VATDALPLEPAEYHRYQRVALIAGAVGLVLCLLGWILQPAAFFRSYLWAYLFFLGIALGCLVLDMLQFLTGGAWGLVLRRLLEAVSRTLPVLALLFLPLVLGFFLPTHGGLRGMYIWADPAVVSQDHALQHKAPYLNVPFFIIRAVIYFGIWLTVMYFVNRWSAAEDRPDAGDPRHLRKLSSAGLVLYGATITFASIDWVMSLEPRWYSSIYGALFGIGQVLNAMAFAVIALVLLSDRPPLAGIVSRPILRDLGNLMLTFVMLWAYLSFSQFLLIWSGNLPPEIPFYLRRFQGGWQWVGVALIVFHFALPFVLLLSFELKRHGTRLLAVAVLVLFMRAVDLFWQIIPAQPGPEGTGAFSLKNDLAGAASVAWTSLAALVGVGGVWLAVLLGQLQRRRLLPVHDPLLAEALHHE